MKALRRSLPSVTLAVAAFAVGSIRGIQAAPAPPDPPPFENPKPPPANVSSSEAVPPLPYPAVAMKRQERKSPPKPPVLLTKIRTSDDDDWCRAPDDLKNLLEWMAQRMNLHFTSNIKPFAGVSTDPESNPVLYRSGYKEFRLEPGEAGALREYLLKGGTIVFNALVGHPDFYRSALVAAKQILPERPLYRLRPDHPAFHSYHSIGQVRYRDRMVRDGMVTDNYPYIDGVDIDNRTAIFISRWDLALGWEANAHESWGYADEDARRLGANIVCYATAMRDSARSVGRSVELVNADGLVASLFRVGRVRYDGPWNTRSVAFPMLLNQFHQLTGAPVSFELHDVSLLDASLFDTPFLYLTGTIDFRLSDQERAGLRGFLTNGGVLFAEASEGRRSFDQAFRAEIARIFPERSLERLPATHPIFREPAPVEKVKARAALAARQENRVELSPELYGLEVDGALAVIYSPNDLSAGWERAIAPYAIGYEAADATALGVNALFYAVTH